MKEESKEKFICGNCINYCDGFCDYLGILTDEDDRPHCTYGKGWESLENFKKQAAM